NSADQASDFLSSWFWVMGKAREAIMGLSPHVSAAMRNPSILSGTPRQPARPLPAHAPARPRPAVRPRPVFDACQIGVVLRAVLIVEAVVAIAALFWAPAFADWLLLAATV